MQLIKATEISKEAYERYITEWEVSGEKIVPMSAARNNRTFEALLEAWAYDESEAVYEKNFVPSTTYFLVDEVQNIKGALNLRHTLNAGLKKEGGHIGYGVLPSARGNGYAKKMVELVYGEVKKHGIKKVLITCNNQNKASYKTIENLGGVLENIIEHNDHFVRRYWLSIK